MRNDMFKKGLVLGIIILFFGTSVLPNIIRSQGEITKNNSNSLNQISYEKNNFNNNSPNTLGLTDGLVGYWNFDEGNGTIIHDSSGNGFDGFYRIDNHGPTWVEGISGYALRFSSNYEEYVNFFSPVLNNPPYTISVWVKPDSASGYSYVIDNCGGLGFSIMEANNEWILTVYGHNAWDEISTPITSTDWTNLLATWDGSTQTNSVKLFINGIQKVNGTPHSGNNDGSLNLVIGAHSYRPAGLYPFNGIIDEPRIYNRVLDEGEIRTLYTEYINHPPIANFSYSPINPKDLDIIQFTDNSTDSDGTIVSWSWNFGDGATSSIQNPTHQYTNDGTYLVNLTVTDDKGATDTIQKTIVVSTPTPNIVFVDNDYTSATPGWGYDHFNVIQVGINAVSDGGTVFVYSGTYYENVNINRDNIKLIGEDKNTTIIDGQETPYLPVIQTRSYILISGFTISNSTNDFFYFFGIKFEGSFVTVQDCNIKDCGIGIYSDGYQNNSIVNCSIFNNWAYGIWVRSYYGSYVRNYFISKCKFFDNSGEAVRLTWAVNCTIDSCLFMNNGVEIIEIQSSFYNRITNCNISNNHAYCRIYGGSSYNVITGNTFLNNGAGIVIGDSSTINNVIYHNNFINNNAVDGGNNSWDNGYPSGGNYWSSYVGVDQFRGPNQNEPGPDGIGDTPYNFPSDCDLYPFMQPNGWLLPPPNQPPISNFTYTPSTPTDLNVIQFTDKSNDSDGTIASWNWNFGDGSTSALQNPTHHYADEGTYHVTLTVTDDDGASNSTSKDIIVSNVAPVSNADGPYTCELGQTITFDGSKSYDNDGTIVSYQWTFGDGAIGTGMNPTHKYSNYGTYTVTLLVTDDDGATDQDYTTAMVPYRYPPVVHLIYPIGGETLKDTITIKWSAHDTEDGNNLQIYFYYSSDNGRTWSPFTSNPQENTGQCNWDTTKLPDGTYLLQISAKDSDNNFDWDTSGPFQIKNHEQPPVNHEPVKPNTPSGPIQGKAGVEYSYTTSTTDPDGDQVYYLWDWGDGNNSGWLGPYNSGATIDTLHKWTVKGSYSIKVKAKDIHGNESVWSDPLPITMPYTFNKPILQFLELLFQRFPNAFSLLRHLLGY